MRHHEIEIPPHHLASVCRLLGCAADDAIAALCELEEVDSGRYLRHPSGAMVRTNWALPWRDGILFRVTGILRPKAPPTVAAPRSHRPLSAWLA